MANAPIPNPRQNLIPGQNYKVVSITNHNVSFTGTFQRIINSGPYHGYEAQFSNVYRPAGPHGPPYDQTLVSIRDFNFYGPSAANQTGGRRGSRKSRRRRASRRRRN